MKKECAETRANLVEYLYDEAGDEGMRERVKTHLRGCGDCSAELEKLKKIESAAKGMKVEFPDAVWDMHRKGILAGLARTKRKDFIFDLHFDIKRAGIALALVLIIIGVLTQFGNITKFIAQRTPSVMDDVDMVQNIEIIERLDFYKKLSKAERI
jgi:hypothetical protein